MWRDAIADLNEQLHVEGIEEDEDGQKMVIYLLIRII
jgi:hypothetical protein